MHGGKYLLATPGFQTSQCVTAARTKAFCPKDSVLTSYERKFFDVDASRIETAPAAFGSFSRSTDFAPQILQTASNDRLPIQRSQLHIIEIEFRHVSSIELVFVVVALQIIENVFGRHVPCLWKEYTEQPSDAHCNAHDKERRRRVCMAEKGCEPRRRGSAK